MIEIIGKRKPCLYSLSSTNLIISFASVSTFFGNANFFVNFGRNVILLEMLILSFNFLFIKRWSLLASSDACQVQVMQHETLPYAGVQYHPEVENTEFGAEIFQNFLDKALEWNK